jgi:ankyrin repeat protein
LVENGINVNQRNDKGKTALDIAIEKGHNEISEYLQCYIQQ